MSNRRHFIRAVAIAVGGWCLWIFFARFVLAWLQATYYYVSTPFFFVQGVNLGLDSAMVLQFAVWWLWYRPASRRWFPAALMLALLLVVKLLTYLVPSYYDFIQIDMGASFDTPLSLELLYVLGVLVMVFGYAIGIHLLSPILRFQFVPAEEASGAIVRPGQWSVTSLMVITAVAALILTLAQATLRLQAEVYSEMDFPAVLGGAALVSLAYHSFDAILVAAFLLCIAKRPNAKWRKLVRWLPVIGWGLIKTVVDLCYLYFAYPEFSLTLDPISYLMSTGTNYLFQAATIDMVTRWFFRRWKAAGFELVSSAPRP